ncbi:MAG: lipoyl synthase [Acidobacteria bacterium]|nr:MAG: lipoyl synthase [Acidobacteriota bacterium]
METLVQLETEAPPREARPEWLRVRLPGGENYQRLKSMVHQLELHTVCESAHCPNIGDCWNRGTATFMILGNLCTRRCGFCAVPKGRPLAIDWDEPRRVADAVQRLKLRHAVITSVDRDDDNLGGARVFAQTIAAIHEQLPECSVEVLIPDFRGSEEALRIVLNARPQILNHNTETVPELYRFVRPGAKFDRSLELLRNVKRFAPGMLSKSGLMLGLGETEAQLMAALQRLADTGCDILTLGQYLRPSRNHLPVKRMYTPQEFADIKQQALTMGFGHVEAGPLVRSSYHARDQAEQVVARTLPM